ncbi:MAG: beta-phosphoglucomutase [Bacteroidia bacterium]|nr:beta-phosphoglucomutase [Bacteroidia bacterium]
MIKAIIFDLDGVIVDTAQYHYLAWKRLAKEYGLDLTLDQNELLKGVSRMRSLEIILDLGGISLSKEEMERIANKKNGWFVEYLNEMTPEEIFPGVRDMLRSIRANGLRVALASSSKNANKVVRLLNIENEFDAIVDGTMIVNSKPDPEIFLLAAKKLSVDPASCVVFEDAEAGVEAALAAGMKCVGVGSAEQLGKANLVIAKTADFTLQTLNSEF